MEVPPNKKVGSGRREILLRASSSSSGRQTDGWDTSSWYMRWERMRRWPSVIVWVRGSFSRSDFYCSAAAEKEGAKKGNSVSSLLCAVSPLSLESVLLPPTNKTMPRCPPTTTVLLFAEAATRSHSSGRACVRTYTRYSRQKEDRQGNNQELGRRKPDLTGPLQSLVVAALRGREKGSLSPPPPQSRGPTTINQIRDVAGRVVG